MRFAPVGGGVVVLSTVTETGVDVPVLPAASRARTVMVCAPFESVVVSSVKLYGLVVSSVPITVPSTSSVTPTTPMLSVALALTVVVPERVEPPAGLVTVAVGLVVSLVVVPVVREKLSTSKVPTAASVWNTVMLCVEETPGGLAVIVRVSVVHAEEAGRVPKY